jgi:hypothetical protein
MYHSLDVERLQTVPPEKHFVQIDNTSAQNMNAHKLRPQKTNPLHPKKFRAFSALAVRKCTPASLLLPHFEFTSSLNILN